MKAGIKVKVTKDLHVMGKLVLAKGDSATTTGRYHLGTVGLKELVIDGEEFGALEGTDIKFDNVIYVDFVAKRRLG